jgi:N-acetylneuraminic acid mutarotase
MSEKKHNFAISVLEGFIYVFGGYDSLDKTAKKSCAKFSLSNEGWDLLPTLRRARNRCYSQPISSDKLAVFGGVNGTDPVLGIEIFTISERKFDIYEPTLQLPL